MFFDDCVDSIVNCVDSILYCNDSTWEWYPYQPTMEISGNPVIKQLIHGYVIITLCMRKHQTVHMYLSFFENFRLTNQFGFECIPASNLLFCLIF